MDDFNVLMEQRFKKVDELRQAGVEPFQYKYDKQKMIAAIKEEFKDVADQETGYTKTAGRVMIKREHGKTGFADLKDDSGRMQIYFRKDTLGDESFDVFKKLDIGDIIGVEGPLFRTHTGEITIIVKAFQLLTKSLRPLPIVKEKDGQLFDEMTDKEMKYRQRYVDLIVNDESRERFRTRSKIVREIRNFMDDYGYIEVETPVLQQVYGGADARPFVTHHNALHRDLYIRISLETYLKRCMVGGFEKVYEINRVFRNEGISKRHNPEFTLMEFYEAYKDLYDMMDYTERLVLHVVDALGIPERKVEYNGRTIDFNTPWRRLSMVDAIKEYASIDVMAKNDDELKAILIKKDKEEEPEIKKMHRGKLIQELFEAFVEEHLVNPVFITDHPLEVSPLAKKKRGDTTGLFVERFELFMNGWELANAFSELNDPIDQEERFAKQEEAFKAGNEEAQRMDEDFIRALQYGLPPAGGCGIGIDRLVMLLTNALTIKDVILFPHLKDEV